MNKIITLCMALMLTTISTVAQTYHEDDKEGLRMFLRQASAEEGKINAEQLGLVVSDTLDWQTGEEWVAKVTSLTWNTETPKRLTVIGYYTPSWGSKNLAGVLDASKWSKLQILYFTENQLTTLDVSKNTELTTLMCLNNQLTALDVSKNTELTNLGCGNNLLNELDVSTNTKLRSLSCYTNQLAALDVSKNTELTTLTCSSNQLTDLDVSTNIKLTTLDCFSNQLTALDVSKNTELTDLACGNNPLNELVVSTNTKLRSLSCYTNQLATLDVSKNTELTTLTCPSNQLTVLDLSTNTKLTTLRCYDNRLPLSDLFAASEKITNQSNKYLGTQKLLPQTVVIGSTIDYSDQNLFGGKNTQFTVTKYGNSALPSDYTSTDGKITFNKLGNYTVTMTNEAIVSRENYPARAIVDITVTEGAGIGTFNGMARDGAVTFTIGDVVYVGLGYGSDGALSDFWKYSEEYNTWIQIADFIGEARTNAVAFTLNGKAYVGLGRLDYMSSPFGDFYEYDPSTDQWTKCVNDFGGTVRHNAVCFVIEDKAYVGTGESSTGTTQDFWSFDGTIWTELSSNFSGRKRRGAAAFVINNKAYVTGGFDNDDSYQLSDVREYDPATNTWIERVFADGLNLSINGATAFSYNGKGYICYGNKNFIASYDPATNMIENLGDELNFGGVRSYPISFLFKGIPYVGLGSSYSGGYDTNYHNDIVPLFEPTSIKTPAIDAIHINPNPVSESFRISGITENTLVTISDISGKTVLQCIVSPNDAVSVECLPKGMYIVRAAGKTVKMIKQ